MNNNNNKKKVGNLKIKKHIYVWEKQNHTKLFTAEIQSLKQKQKQKHRFAWENSETQMRTEGELEIRREVNYRS